MKSKKYKNEHEELKHSIAHGVSFDNIKLKNVVFWMVLGIIVVTIALFGLYHLYFYHQYQSAKKTAVQAEYHELNERRAEESRMLNSFELVDEEQRLYRIPIDSAMILIVRDRN